MTPVEPRGLPVPEFDAERLLEVLGRHGVEYVVVGALVFGMQVAAADRWGLSRDARGSAQMLTVSIASAVSTTERSRASVPRA